ncbi:MAG: MlaA family lipoprotein [Burkholderiaceae bacterium]
MWREHRLWFGGLVGYRFRVGNRTHHLDFGQTLGAGGSVRPLSRAAYLRSVLCSGRSGLYHRVERDLVQGLSDVPTRNSLYALRAVETRANLLRATSMLEGAALDKYSFTRDIYLNRRESQVEDLKDKGVGLKNGQ